MSLRRRLTPGFPGWRAAALDLVAGASVATAQAPVLAWYMAFPGLVWVIWRLSRPGTEAGGFWAGWFAGAGYFGAGLTWIVSPFFVDPWVHGWMAPFAFVLMAFGLGLFWGVASALAVRLPGRLAGLAALLAGAELLRGHIFTGFPWAQVGQLWLGSPVEQMAAWIGATGLTVLTMAVAALPVASRRWGTVAAAVLVVSGLGLGMLRTSGAYVADRDATLRLIQPNAEQSLKWDPDEARVLFQRQLDLTAGGPPVDLVIWPETSVPYLFEYSPEVAGLIAAAARGGKVALGIQRVEGERGWNSLRIVEGAGVITATYDKHHLVPFGEYVPLGDLLADWFGIGAFAAQMGNGYSAGPGPQVIDLGPRLGRVLPLICYEAVFPAIPRGVEERPDWMLQITNDAWFGTMTGPFQHFQQARLRAIEMGLPLVRVANTGVTAVIDARGGVSQVLPFGQAGALEVGPLPGALLPTTYARHGDLAAFLLLVCLGLLSAIRLRRKAA